MLASRFSSRRTEYRSEQPIADEVIRRYAPSVFAESAHDSRSQRYSFIPTIQVLAGLRREGFEPFHVGQQITRTADRRSFAKHLVRLRHRSTFERADEEAYEIVLLNSHDGSSSYQMLAGEFRFVCCNGLVVGNTDFDVRVPHKGDVTGQVIEGAYRVLDGREPVTESIAAMKGQPVSEGQALAFGRAALELRYDEGAPISPARAIEPRRREDTRNDVFSLFNRVQENLVRGGQHGRDERDQRRRMTTRQITGIDQGLKLNRALWTLAEALREQIA